VLGVPLNKLEPSLPRHIVNSSGVSTLATSTYRAGSCLGNKIGQNGADSHWRAKPIVVIDPVGGKSIHSF